MKYDVIVIGAGLNGLTAAALLGKAGKRVLVVERSARLGGAAVTEELIDGYNFNSVTDQAGWLPPDLISELNLTRHGLELLTPEESVVIPITDGRALTLWRDIQRTYASIRTHSPRDSQQWEPFAARMHKLAGFLATLYAAPAPRPIGGGARELLDMARLGKRARSLGKADMIELLRVLPMSVWELLEDWFETDALKGALGAAGVQGIQQGVRSAGTAFVMLHHHVGQNAGAFRMQQRFRGGVGSVASALAAAARPGGVQIRLNAEVTQIAVDRWTASGVVLTDGEVIAADRVLSSVPLRRTMIDMVDVAQLDPVFVHEVRNVRARGVTARMHLALSRLPSFRGVDAEALRGVISLAPDLDYIERAYDDAKYGRMSQKPLLEIRIPSLADASLAPPGRHAMSVTMQYAPFELRAGGWGKDGRAMISDVVLKLLAEAAPDLPNLVVDQRVLTPLDLATGYQLPEASLDYAELGLDQILFMRPLGGYARYETPIANLYICGADTHPGRAIAGGSGRHAARKVLS